MTEENLMIELKRRRGVAQVVERLVRDQEAGSSSLLTPTMADFANIQDAITFVIAFLFFIFILCVSMKKTTLSSRRCPMCKADEIFAQHCREILESGYSTEHDKVRPKWEDGTSAYTVKAFCLVNRYDLREEFPILTQRFINFRAAVDELLWIWQKKSNNVRDLSSRIWDSWADGNGSIGKAYGYQLGVKHRYAEGEFDQVDRVLYDLKNNPGSRRIMTNIYVHQDLYAMNLYPCAYSMTFNVTGNRLNAILNQRSQDMLVANGWNVAQYAVLVHLMARCAGLEVGEFVHVIADAHIYDRHIPIVRELIDRPSYPAPRLVIAEGIDDFYRFTVDDIQLEQYESGPKIKSIPVAV